MSRDAFISYKTEDKEAAERLCASLEREGISCWMAPRDIPPGHDWAGSIMDGLQRSKSFVLLLSSHSAQTKQIAREVELADQHNIPILTFRLEDVQPPNSLLYFLGNLQWVDGFGGQFDSAAARLVDVIRKSDSYPAPKTTTRPTPPLPVVEVPAAQPAIPRNRYLLPIGAAALLAVIGLGAWLGMRPSASTTDDGKTTGTGEVEKHRIEDVKIVAERFLDERDSGNYDAAWNECSEAFHKRTNRAEWQEASQKRNESRGGCTEHKFRTCRNSKDDQYVCGYTLVFKDGSKLDNDLWVGKNPTGGWSIDEAKIQ